MPSPFASPFLGPVPPDARTTGLTYEPFYGLREKPFSLTSDPRFFYQSRAHAPAFDDLLNTIKRRESLHVLTGDIGTGKTTLCRAVVQHLDRKTFSAFVTDPFASREELLKVLLTDFGVASVEDVTSGRLRGASRTELSYLLADFLRTLAPLQAFAVVFIDEAQNLTLPVLEEVRILSDADGQLQVVLVGQLELHGKLRTPEMRQLDQRVSARCALQPLDVAGVAGYISHRLHRAGGSADRVSFSGEAVELIYERSGGVPRVINRLCDRALHAGYARKASVIDGGLVEGANRDDRIAPSPARVAAVASPPPVTAIADPAPASPAPPFADPVEVWLQDIDGLDANPPAAADCWTANPVTTRRRPDPGKAVRIRVGTPDPRRRVDVGRVPRKWTRRLEALVLCLLLLLLALIAGPSAWDAGGDVMAAINEQFDPPAPPAAPSDPAVRVALPRAPRVPDGPY